MIQILMKSFLHVIFGTTINKSLILLGEWYDSASLHYKQWGYPESIIKGKELNASINHICSVSEAYEIIQKHIQRLYSNY